MSELDDLYPKLTLEEVEALLGIGILLPSSNTKKHRVSTAVLGSLNSTPSLPSNTPSAVATVAFHGFTRTSTSSFELPVNPRSPEAIEFCGFKLSTAQKIYKRWMNRTDPEHCPDDLIDYVYADSRHLGHPVHRSMSDREAMSKIGLNEEMQDVLTDSRFSAISSSNTLTIWVLDTIKTNYRTLGQLQLRLKDYAIRRLAFRSQHRASGLKDIFNRVDSSDTKSVHFPRPESTLEDHSLPSIHVALGDSRAVIPNHVTLYKSATSGWGMEYEHDHEAWIQPDGSLNMRTLDTQRMHRGAAEDFNHTDFAQYWTQDKEIAELYRAFVSRRCFYTETWLITIQIPQSFVQSLKVSRIYYSPDWKEYVWHCRKGRRPPPKHDRLWNGKDLIIGHIFTNNGSNVTRVSEEHIQIGIGAHNVLRVPGTGCKATQWAFLGSAFEPLAEAIKGKIHIDIMAPTSQVLGEDAAGLPLVAD